jgi:hypothetical protein
METFKNLAAAETAHKRWGGILFVMASGGFLVCHHCCPGDENPCGECGRTKEQLAALAPSWSEASPENSRRLSGVKLQRNLF